MGLMPEGRHGAVAGVFEASRGIGALLGPALAGIAIWLAEPLFAATDGYAAVFGVAALALLASAPLLRSVRAPRRG